MAQVSHSTSQDHIATAFHFFKVKRGPLALELLFFVLASSDEAEDEASMGTGTGSLTLIFHDNDRCYPVAKVGACWYANGRIPGTQRTFTITSLGWSWSGLPAMAAEKRSSFLLDLRELRKGFDAVDTEGRGYIDFDGLKLMIEGMQGLDGSMANELMDSLDRDKDGKVGSAGFFVGIRSTLAVLPFPLQSDR